MMEANPSLILCKGYFSISVAKMQDEKTPLTVGRGPVPRHATIAGETRSDARLASEGPRDTGTSRPGGLSYREGIDI